MELKRLERRVDAWTVAAILLVCLVFAAVRWLKIDSLLREDPAMWLFQMGRAARGELIYRDFTWNYPPFSVWIFSGWFRIFGITFTAAQVLIDLLSLGIVLLGYWLLRYFLPRSLHFVSILTLVAIGATAQTKFTLFSFLTYSPSLHTATIGLLLMMIGLIRYFRSGSLGWLNTFLIAGGAFISQTSKPESLLVSAVLLLLVWRRIPLILASILPAMAAYAWQISQVGVDNLKAGISGYGLASFACPWWPTGLGVYGALASLAQAVLIAAVASWPLKRRFSLAAIPCGLFYLSYYWYLNSDVLTSSHTLAYKIQQVGPLLLWTSPVLLPVMWVGILLTCYLGYRLLFGKTGQTGPADLEYWILLAVPVIMSSRGLFGTTLYPYTEVSAVCYAFFILVAPVMLWKFLSQCAPSSTRPALIVGSLMLAYSVVRLVGGYSLFLSNRHYTELQTNAGLVQVRDNDGSGEIYTYLTEHTGPADPVLILPCCGGINFAAGRPSPTYTTLFTQLRPDMRFQMQDLEGVRTDKPKVIIADDAPNYGTAYGWTEKMECPCPRLVWAPDQLSATPDYIFPVVRYIRENYRVDRRIGGRFLLVPK